MAAHLLGFDSAAPLTLERWRAVEAATGFRPRAVALYCGGQYRQAAPETVALAHGQGAGVVFVYNGTSAVSVGGTLEQGRADGQRAAAALQALGAPSGTGVFADIEAPWQPSAEWVAGWAYGVLQVGYAPGVYGAPASPAFAAAVDGARARYIGVRLHLRLYAASWYQDLAPTVLPEWAAPAVRGLEPVGWQYRGNVALPRLPEDTGVDLALWRPDAPFWHPAGSTAQAQAAATADQVLVQIQGTVDREACDFTFEAELVGPSGRPVTTRFVLDTGAFEMLISPATAQELGITGGTPLQVGGVGGPSAAYETEVDLLLQGHSFPGTRCVVDGSSPGQLFGLRWVIAHGLELELDTRTGILTFRRG